MSVTHDGDTRKNLSILQGGLFGRHVKRIVNGGISAVLKEDLDDLCISDITSDMQWCLISCFDLCQ